MQLITTTMWICVYVSLGYLLSFFSFTLHVTQSIQNPTIKIQSQKQKKNRLRVPTCQTCVCFGLQVCITLSRASRFSNNITKRRRVTAWQRQKAIGILEDAASYIVVFAPSSDKYYCE
jgi:Fe-S cluster assembly iron-binding protein IscA